MVQKYQNEIPPIFYYGISTKTNEKDLKIPNLQALTLGRIIKMTLYIKSGFAIFRETLSISKLQINSTFMFQALKLYQKKMKNQIDVWAGN